MDEKILGLYDAYSKGSLDRREFLKKLAALAGSFSHYPTPHFPPTEV
jgi:hypothetical protein